MSVSDHAIARHDRTGAVPGPAPILVAGAGGAGTGLILLPRTDALPAVWAGPVPPDLDPGDIAPLLAAVRPCPLLPEHGEGWFGRPGLAGHRLGSAGAPAAGRDWSPLFRPGRVEHDGSGARIEAADTAAGPGGGGPRLHRTADRRACPAASPDR